MSLRILSVVVIGLVSFFGSLVNGFVVVHRHSVETRRKAYENFDEAEDAALKLCKEGNFTEALPIFKLSLDLPGDGYDIVRVQRSASPVGGATVLRDLEESRFPSIEQKQTAYFNIAACHAQLGENAKALDAIETTLSLGFDDFDLLLSDKDFAELQSDIQRLIAKYKEEQKSFFPNLIPPSVKGLPSFGSIFGGKDSSS